MLLCFYYLPARLELLTPFSFPVNSCLMICQNQNHVYRLFFAELIDSGLIFKIMSAPFADVLFSLIRTGKLTRLARKFISLLFCYSSLQLVWKLAASIFFFFLSEPIKPTLHPIFIFRQDFQRDLGDSPVLLEVPGNWAFNFLKLLILLL